MKCNNAYTQCKRITVGRVMKGKRQKEKEREKERESRKKGMSFSYKLNKIHSSLKEK